MHSLSYGEPEGDIGVASARRLNLEFAKLGLRGVTIVSTSGDIGVGDGNACVDSEGRPALTADFPSSSPFTTSIGATQLIAPGLEGAATLTAGAGFTTGGMFSTLFPRPSFQERHLASYLDSVFNDLPAGSKAFNRTGRAYNDVAALGANVPIVLGGEWQSTGGTSASGPIVAAIFALLNQLRNASSLPPLGLANGWLYAAASSRPDAFNALADGGSNACGEPGLNGAAQCCTQGFTTTTTLEPTLRWSVPGGLGTPNFGVLATMSTVHPRSW